jgi:myo-inositol-1(or 4)-monophosphatase
MLGISTYNVLSVASMGAALGGVESTPKIWDIAATWAIVQAAVVAGLRLMINRFSRLRLG